MVKKTETKEKGGKATAGKGEYHIYRNSIEKIMGLTSQPTFIPERITEYELFKIIRESKELSHYIPPIEEVRNSTEFLHFVKKHKRVIARPLYGKNEVYCLITERDEDEYQILGDGIMFPLLVILTSGELKHFFERKIMEIESIILQKYIRPARIRQSSYDMRIMLKRSEKTWKCLGIECKVGENKFIFSCLEKGKISIPIREILRKTFPIGCDYEKIIRKVRLLCLRACKSLKHLGEFFKRFDFDIAIDENRRLWIIGIKYYSSHQEFKVIDYKIYKPSTGAPLLYAASIE